ncbi:hypothetical protein Q5752_005721 [Cryptotrichosporon argae]
MLFSGLAALVPLLALSTPVAADELAPRAGGSDAWHLDWLYTIVKERLDPIVNPNGISSHVHRVVGGSMFGANYNSDQYLSAKCTSAGVTKDNSNYWMPQLYWRENGKYISIAADIRFYYFLSRNSPDEPVQPFPPGLRMLVGNPNAKSLEDTGMTLQSFIYTCQNQHYTSNSQDTTSTNFNFDYTCGDGLKTELKFPPCWDGVNLYLPGNKHMAYSDTTQYGKCPYSHPIRLPGIMLEYTWQTQKLRPGAKMNGNLIWANGDTTGYGMHGDFINGWDYDVLNQALNDPTCVGLGYEIPMQQCKTLGQYMDTTGATAKACSIQRGLVNETNNGIDGVAVSSLPGCNLPWSSGAKPTCSPAVTNPSLPSALTGSDGAYAISDKTQYVSSFVQQQVAMNNGTGSPGIPAFDDSAASKYDAGKWQEVACLRDSSSLRAMQYAVNYTDKALTPAKCQQFCYTYGYVYSGLLGGNNCQCASSFNASQYTSDCNTSCSGDSSQKCGGNGVDVFYNPTLVGRPRINSDTQYIGCRKDGGDGKTLNAASVQNKTMTPTLCKAFCKQKGYTLAALEYGNKCWCDNAFKAGGQPYPEALCNTACQGDTSLNCGGSTGGMAVYNLSLSAAGNIQANAVVASISAATSASSKPVSSSAKSAASSTTAKTSTASAAAASGSCPAAVTVTKTTTVTPKSTAKRALDDVKPPSRRSKGKRDFFGRH